MNERANFGTFLLPNRILQIMILPRETKNAQWSFKSIIDWATLKFSQELFGPSGWVRHARPFYTPRAFWLCSPLPTDDFCLFPRITPWPASPVFSAATWVISVNPDCDPRKNVISVIPSDLQEDSNFLTVTLTGEPGLGSSSVWIQNQCFYHTLMNLPSRQHCCQAVMNQAPWALISSYYCLPLGSNSCWLEACAQSISRVTDPFHN